MHWGRTLLRNRFTPIIALVVAGTALGVVAGNGAVGRIELADKGSRPAPRRPASLAEPAASGPVDPLAREVGYSIASAWEVTTLSGCSSIDARFRAGCHDYVREQARARREAEP